MSHSNAYERRPTDRSTVHLTIHDGRYFELADVEDDAPSLWISDLPRSDPWPMTTIRVFAEKANLRELRDLLNRADLGDCDEYDPVYVAAVRAWEAVGVS